MRKINFAEPQTANWCSWRQQCQQEQELHNNNIESGLESSPKNKVYKGKDYNIKNDFYFNPNTNFYGKCAYCEKKITSTQYGDVEHFRPKGEVSDIDFNIIDNHPGYYWLCYDWENLLPSCILCNRKSTTDDDVVIGKHTRFPVRDFRATQPGEESQEEPLLIHPLFEDPAEHIEADSNGVIHAKNGSDRGQACINIFGLNLRDLPNERKQRYDEIRNMMGLLSQALARGGSCEDDAHDLLRKLQCIKEGQGEFTSVAHKALMDAKNSIDSLGLLHD